MTEQIAERIKIRSVSAAFAWRTYARQASASLAVGPRRRDGARVGVGPHAT